MATKSVTFAMCCTIGIVLLDESATAIILNDIRSEYGVSRGEVNWVLTVYLVALSSTVAAFGRLADVFGLKRLLLTGVALFAIASVAASCAPGLGWLLLARVLQGLGAAMAFPSSAGILRAITPAERLGTALGYFGTASALGLMTGPLLGGWLTEQVSWRAVFAPGAVVALLVWLIVLRGYNASHPRAPAEQRFDWPGCLSLIVALGTLITWLMQGPAWGWLSPASLGLVLCSVTATLLFVRIERSRSDPVIQVGLFRNRTFASANATTLMAQFAKTSVIVYAPYYMIEVLGMSPFEAGNGLLPGIVVALFVAPWTGKRVDRYGARAPVLIALFILCASLLYLSWAVGKDSYAFLVPGLLGWGIGATAMFAGSRRAVQGAVQTAQSGQASGINATAQWLGAALSVPVFGIFVHHALDFPMLYLCASIFVAVAFVAVWMNFERG